MIQLISHRGNLNGPNIKTENHPTTITEVLSNKKLDAEIDLRIVDGEWVLGHDEPQYNVDESWVIKFRKRLWVHCKDLETLSILNSNKKYKKLNYFFHDTDGAVLTSKGYIWGYPGKCVKNSIFVMPEWNDDIIDTSCIGICTDYINKYYTYGK